MSQARIYQVPKNSMSSGRARTKDWVLEFVSDRPKRADPLMGWAGGGETREQVVLTFDTLEEAQAYAQREGIAASVATAAIRRLKIQAYADNFR